MTPYPKIKNLYTRDPGGILLPGYFTEPCFEYLYANDWVATEKIDGMNIRVLLTPNEGCGCCYDMEFRGRSDRAMMPPKLMTKLQGYFGEEVLDDAWKHFDGHSGVCIYGEGYGAGINKGDSYVPDQGVDFVVFDIRIGEWWCTPTEVMDACATLGLPCVVPWDNSAPLNEWEDRVLGGLESEYSWEHKEAEGLVLRPAVPMRMKSGERIITKLKTRDMQRAAHADRKFGDYT